MQNDIQKVNICDGVNFSYIKHNKFKTNRISFTLFLPLDKNEVSKNAIIPGILEKSCESYPSLSELNQKLDELYGASIYSGIDKLGDFQVLTVSAVCINDKFSLEENSIVKEVAHLLKEVIFNPALENDKFKEDQVAQEKRQLIELIEAEYNDKRRFAKRRCEELMCADERFGISKYGNKDQAEIITAEDVTFSWKNTLKSARIEIMMIGDSGFEDVIDEFKTAFSNIKRTFKEMGETEVLGKPEKISEFKDIMDVTQSKLVMGFRTPIATPNKDVPAMRLMTSLLGGTPTSKLFMNVREKLSLCYYCSAGYNKQKGIMTIESGVQKENIEKAKDEILNQLKSIQNGEFTDEELTQTKIYISQTFEKVKDSLSLLDDWYVFQAINSKIKSPEEAIEEINKVNREDVIKAAKEVNLDTVYILTDGEEK